MPENDNLLFLVQPEIKKKKSKKRKKTHPIRNSFAYLSLLFKDHGEPELIKQVTLAVQGYVLKVTCHDDEAYQKVKRYEGLVSREILKGFSVHAFLCQYDVHYAVWKALRDFEQKGITEFTVAQVTNEVNKLQPPQRTETRIKGVLQKFCQDLSEHLYYSHDLPQWLLDLRGLKPIVNHLGRGVFRLVPKPAPKPKKEKKSGKNR